MVKKTKERFVLTDETKTAKKCGHWEGNVCTCGYDAEKHSDMYGGF